VKDIHVLEDSEQRIDSSRPTLNLYSCEGM